MRIRYEATDGQLFCDREECLAYETKIKMADKVYDLIAVHVPYSEDAGYNCMSTLEIVSLIVEYFDDIKAIIEGVRND